MPPDRNHAKLGAVADTATHIESLRAPTTGEWAELARAVDDHLLATLTDLSDDDWNKPTECEPWAVRDVVAHLVGWDEAIVSPREFVRQTVAGYRTRKAHDGNPLDAQNQFQVDERSALSPIELLERLRTLTPKFHKAKQRFASIGWAIPLKQNFSGTWVTARYAMTTILARDHFMHHIDIHTATGRAFQPNEADVRIAHDAIREWAEQVDADVTLELSGGAGGTFVRRSGATTITADAIGFCRLIAGRRYDDIKVAGDKAAAKGWLAQPAVF